MIILIALASPGPLTLRVHIAPDGSTQVAGKIRVQDRVLVATGGGQASCADVNDDGTAELVGLEIPVRDATSGAPGRVVLETMPREEITGTGVFMLSIEVDDERTTVEAGVRVRRGPIPRQRRQTG